MRKALWILTALGLTLYAGFFYLSRRQKYQPVAQWQPTEAHPAPPEPQSLAGGEPVGANSEAEAQPAYTNEMQVRYLEKQKQEMGTRAIGQSSESGQEDNQPQTSDILSRFRLLMAELASLKSASPSENQPPPVPIKGETVQLIQKAAAPGGSPVANEDASAKESGEK